MLTAPELHQVAPSLFLWHLYDPKVKAELFSTALVTRDGLYLVDPVPLDQEPMDELIIDRHVRGIIVTNGNHRRASDHWADLFDAPVLAHPASFDIERPARFVELADGTRISADLEVISIQGAVPGEIVLHHTTNSPTLIVGDALIHWEPYGFTFLPGKYCLDEKRMRQSLQKLGQLNPERLFFAHGLPILRRASERLRTLLEVHS